MLVSLLIFLIITVVAAALQAPSEIGVVLLILDFVLFVLCVIRVFIKCIRRVFSRKKPEQYKQRELARQEHRAQRAKEAQIKREQRIADNTIVSTAIVNSTMTGKQTASVTSSIVRGAVGGVIFGPVGLVAGAVTPKKRIVTKDATVTFSILFKSGKRSVETVRVGSARYNELAKYIA